MTSARCAAPRLNAISKASMKGCATEMKATLILSNFKHRIGTLLYEAQEVLKSFATPQELEKAQSGWMQEIESALNRDHGSSFSLTIGRIEEEQFMAADAKAALKKKSEDDEGEVFVLGFWSDAYRAGDREYFWLHCKDGTCKEVMKAAREMAAVKQQHGQPKTITHWVKGVNRFFTDRAKFIAAAGKAGFVPNLAD